MIPKVVSIPIRFGLSATRTTLSLSTKLAGAAAGAAFQVARSRFASPTPPAPAGASSSSSSRSSDPAPMPTPFTPAASAGAPDRTVVVDEPVVAPDDQPDTPVTAHAGAVKTVDDADEVVAEFAEAGAEDGAGAQLHLEEPWAGYDSDTADAVIARIGDADAAEIALLELYEQVNKQRKTVLEAAARRLRELSA